MVGLGLGFGFGFGLGLWFRVSVRKEYSVVGLRKGVSGQG